MVKSNIQMCVICVAVHEYIVLLHNVAEWEHIHHKYIYVYIQWDKSYKQNEVPVCAYRVVLYILLWVIHMQKHDHVVVSSHVQQLQNIFRIWYNR